MANEMTHEEAARMGAAEKYILDELAPEERERFEEHYFDCPECAAEVKLGAIFGANARAVFEEEAGRTAAHRPAAPQRVHGMLGWRRPAFAFAFAMAALLLVLNIALLFQNARLRAPQSYPAFVLHSVSRGDEQVLEAFGSSRFVGIALDVPPDRPFPAYRCALTGAGGAVKLTLDTPAPPDPSAALNILLPVASLEPGRYTLVVYGMRDGISSELSRYPFLFKLK
jgi:hypothetical protein